MSEILESICVEKEEEGIILFVKLAENIKLDEIKAVALKIPGVTDFHHIHIWAISTTENALTAHLVLPRGTSIEEERHIKGKLKHELLHKNIQHITIETERENGECTAAVCT